MLLFSRAGYRVLGERLVLVAPAADRSANRLDAAFGTALFLALLLLAACGGGGGTTGGGGGPGGSPAVLVSIAISPANPALQVGTSLQLFATGTYSDGATRDLTGTSSWASNATQVATVAPGGVVSAVAGGSAMITATSGGISTSTTVTVPVAPPTVTLTFIHNFQGPLDGAQPSAPLLQASDGNFYGTTLAGGTNRCGPFGISCGTVFRLTPGGNEVVLYSFGASASDGFGPGAPLIQGNDGALYGTTASGGAHGGGTVFRITLGGVYTLLHSFGGSPSDGIVPAALIQGSDGNFYGTTASGGANHCINIPQAGGNCGTVFRITPAGVETVLYSFGGSPSDGVEPLGSLVQASDGNFYGTTIDGGANNCGSFGNTHNCGTVFRMTPAGVVTILHSFGASPTDGIAPQGPLILGSDGALYGTTPSGGACAFCGTVFRITLAGQETILHSFGVNGRPNGTGPSPFLIRAGDGNFYGTTRSGGTFQGDSNGTAFRLTPSGLHTLLYSFGPLNTNPSDPGAGMIQASDGAFYGVTFNSGSASGSGTVFKLVVQ